MEQYYSNQLHIAYEAESIKIVPQCFYSNDLLKVWTGPALETSLELTSNSERVADNMPTKWVS